MLLVGSRLLVLVLVTISSTLVTSAHEQDTNIDETEALKKVKVLEGEGVLFPCNATESPDVDVWWVKNKTRSHFLSSGMLLRFDVVNRMDTGQYLCYVNNTADVTNSTGNATLVDAVMIDVICENRWEVEEGEDLLVPCNVTESPEINVWWTKNETGSHFSHNGSLLRLDDIARTEAGQYLCHAQNTSGESASIVGQVTVDVIYPAEVHLSGGPSTIRQGDRISLTCRVEGNPSPDFTLRNNVSGMLLSSGIQAVNVTVITNPVCSPIPWVFVLSAANKLNHRPSKNNITINVECAPEPKGIIEYRVKSRLGRNATLLMTTLANPKASYTWRRSWDRVQATEGYKSTYLEFQNVGDDDFGLYFLEMSNRLGGYHAIFYLDPTGPPEAPTSLQISGWSYNWVSISFVAGHDVGQRHKFIVMMLDNDNTHVELGRFDDFKPTYRQHLVTLTVTDLRSSTEYDLVIRSENDDGKSGFSNKAHVRTDATPFFWSRSHRHHQAYMYGIAAAFWGIVCFAVAAVVVYVIKYRRLKTSYTEIKGSNQEALELFDTENTL